jgi:hypothetical protein
MIENNDWGRVTEYLAGLRYSCFRYLPDEDRLVPFFGQITNAFYLPSVLVQGRTQGGPALILRSSGRRMVLPYPLVAAVFSSDGQAPAFQHAVAFWADDLYSGFPIFADPNFSNAYPLRVLLKELIPVLGKSIAYNAYVVSAFLVAAIGMYAMSSGSPRHGQGPPWRRPRSP